MSRRSNVSREIARFWRFSPVIRWASLAFLFLIIATWSIWPAPRLCSRMLPSGTNSFATVPMFNAWTIWWNADRMAHGFQGYWDAPIFHPETGTFAFSEPQPATCCVAPIVWLARSPIPAYHAYLLGSLILNGLFTVRLLRTLRSPWWATVVGGIGIVLLPLAHQRGDVLQLIPLWGVLWTIDALIRLRRRPTLQRGVILGLAYSATFMTSVHHGLFWTLLLAQTIWLTIPIAKWQEWGKALAVAMLVAAVCLAPLLLPMRSVLRQHEFARQAATIDFLSAKWSHWVGLPQRALTRLDARGPVTRRPLSPGWVRCAVALSGLFWLLKSRRQRQATLFLLAIALLAFIWSFGLNLRIGTWQPWESLANWVPGFAQVRSPFRFAYFVQLAVILLAAVNLGQLMRLSQQRFRHRSVPAWMWGMVIPVGLLLAIEIPPPKTTIIEVPNVSQTQPWCEYLQRQPTTGAVVCLPFVTGDSVAAHELTTRSMLWSTQHQRPLVNGYSGFFPKSWQEMSLRLHREPFSQATLSALIDIGVEFIVVDTRRMRVDLPDETGRCRLERTGLKSEVFEIWRLTRPDAEQ